MNKKIKRRFATILMEAYIFHLKIQHEKRPFQRQRLQNKFEIERFWGKWTRLGLGLEPLLSFIESPGWMRRIFARFIFTIFYR